METQAPQFAGWLDGFFASYYRRLPVNATFIGVHEYDDRLPDFSPSGIGDAVAEIDDLLQRLATLPDEALSEAEALDRRLAEGALQIQRWEYGSSHFQQGNPSLYTGEAIFSVMSLFLRPFASLEQRVAVAIARMHAIPAFLQQGKENVHQAPLAWTERAMRECTGALAFFGHGIDILMTEQGIADAQFRQAADTAASAFADFQRYLQDTLSRRQSDHYACGEEALALYLRSGHFLQQSASEIEAYALEQLNLAAARLNEQAHSLGFQAARDALARLSNLHPTPEEYYGRYGELWEASRRTAEHADLLTWPDFPLRFVPQPRWAREAAPSLYFLFYRSPAPYDDVTPVEYLVTPIEPDMSPAEQERRLRATNDSVIKLNHVVHHGGIGHHIQNWHAFRAPSRIGQVAAVDCASRIALFCGGTMSEGWACYATDLMAEAGFLTPLETLAEQHTRLRMAARAVVDVRLHTGKLTLEEASVFYCDRVGMPRDAAHAESVKNSMFPGTALMYLMGTDLIHQLRRDLSHAQGQSFDLRRFHDRFLSYGSIPVSLIAEAMRAEMIRDE